jgi:endonuclease/exonuclease/phosphatase (EEP) superfamily protein YafD
VKGTARVLVVVTLLGTGMHAFWARGPYVGGSSAVAAGGPPLHVMTANLRFGRADTAQVLEAARSEGIDVLVLQEVTPEALTGLREAGVAEAFRHHAGRPEPGPAGTMVFSRSRLGGVQRLGTPFGSYAMDVAAPGGPVHLLAVHPRPPIGDVGGWRSDQGAVRHAARAADGPTMVVGDLNATPDHVPMRVLAALGYRDGASEANAGWQPTWPVGRRLPLIGVTVPTLVAIDHVLVRDGLRVAGIESMRVSGSDHRALLAVVTR